MSTKIPYQPLPPLLFAAFIGILSDRFYAPNILFWLLLCFIALLLWIPSRRSVLILIACAAVFGLRHHDHWYQYAENDIGAYCMQTDEQALAQNQDQPAALIGTVNEMPRFYPKPPPDPGKIFETSEKTVFTLRVEQLRDGRHWLPVSGNILVTVFADCRNFRIGDQLQLFGNLSSPVKPNNPGDFDYAGFLRGHRTLALLRCSDSTAVTRLGNHHFSLYRGIESIRRAGIANLEQHLSPKTLNVAEAMIFGVRESVDNEIRQSMLDTGTMHLLAISGLHVSLIAGIAAWFLRLLGCSRRKTAVLMILFVLFYLALTDVRSPAIRATILTCSVALSLFVNRSASAVNVLCASALLVLLIKPSELFQFGAQLSFIAVGSFLWIPRYVRLKSLFYSTHPADLDLQTLNDVERMETKYMAGFRQINKMFRSLIELFLVSLTIWLFSTPIILSQVHLFTPIAILVNPLLWLPLTAAMLFGFLTAILGPFPVLGALFGFAADISFSCLLEMIAWFQRLGGHYWLPGPPNWWNLGFYSVFVGFTFLPIPRPPKKVLIGALTTWILFGISMYYYQDFDRRQHDRLTLSLFSIGHGNSVLITTPEKRTIVCDVGSLTSPRYAADVMSRALWRRGKTHIDAILISHPDLDHCNGVTMLADRFSIGAVLISPYFAADQQGFERAAWTFIKEKLNDKKIPIHIVVDGDDLSVYGLPQSIILHPPKKGFSDSDNINATSLVLRIEHLGAGILLPGDLDGREPSPFLLRKPMQTDIVMVPHHGGRSMQVENLLEWTKPHALLFSTGSLTYKPEILEQFRQKGYEVRSTFVEGMIEIDVEQ